MPEASSAQEGPHCTGVSCAPLCGQLGHSEFYSDQQMSAPSPPEGAVTGLSIPRNLPIRSGFAATPQTLLSKSLQGHAHSVRLRRTDANCG